MKKILIIITAILLNLLPAYCIEEEPIILDEIETINIQPSPDIIELKAEKYGAKKVEPILNTKLFENNIFKSVELHGAYIGGFTFTDFINSLNHTTTYDANVGDITLKGKLRDEKTEMVLTINPLRRLENYDYVNAMFSDFYVKREVADGNYLMLGQARTPTGVEGVQSQYTLLFGQRAQISRNYGNTRTYGIRNQGNYKFIDYDMGIFDSTRYLQTPMQGLEFTGWVTAKPLANFDNKYGTLKIGSGINTGKKEHRLGYTVTGAYVGYEYKKLLANFEYAKAHGGSNGVQAKENSSEGFYTTLGYFIHPQVQLLGRFDYFDNNIHKHGDQVNEITAGINYYIKDQNLRLTLNYVYKDRETGPDSNQYILLTQFAF